MAGVHYLYLHGFQSGPQSLKAQETREFLLRCGQACEFSAPQLSPYPATAIRQLRQLIAEITGPVVLIGSSLGGFYATALAEAFSLPAVLINPAVYPERELANFLGPLHNPYTGEDYVLGREHMAELVAIRPASITASLYWLIVGTEDEVLDWREAADYYAGASQTILEGDDHRLKGWPQCLPGLLAIVARQPAALA